MNEHCEITAQNRFATATETRSTSNKTTILTTFSERNDKLILAWRLTLRKGKE